MKKPLIPLLLIATMVLAVTIASASNFSSGNGGITAENGWTPSSGWESGMWTETHASATHEAKTGPSGAFSYEVDFRIGNASNTLKIGLGTGSGDHYITINGNAVSFDGTSLGSMSVGDYQNQAFSATISSTDGKQWSVTVGGLSPQSFGINAVPTSAILDITKGVNDIDAYGPIIGEVTFVSDDTATPTPSGNPTVSPDPGNATDTPDDPGNATVTPDPSTQPEPAAPQGPAYDIAAVQDFYDNAYQQIYSPYDTITYDGKGGYTITPNTNFGSTTPAAPAATYAVSGRVTAAADGKPIVGASVVLGNDLQKTNYDGQFRFDGTAGGSYDIAVSADGFASKTQSVNVNDNLQLSFALDPASAAGSTTASAANETKNTTTTTTNTTAPVTNTTTTNTTTTTTAANNTTNPAPTQTKSPGFEAIVAAMALIAVAGLVLFVNRKK